MAKYKVRIGRFPYGGSEASECVNWLIQTSVAIARDPRFELSHTLLNDTPITMTRNRMFAEALRDGIDFLLICDSDMAPDVEVGVDPQAKPFWETSIEFLLAQPRPAVVAAPYCGPPPVENVYVFTWDTQQGDHPDSDGQIVQYPRHQAAIMAGIQQAAALPTGLMLIDMRVFAKLRVPFTYYEYHGDGKVCDACGQHRRGPEEDKASTEDVTFSRDLSLAGIPMYCNWDAWAGHVKRKVVRKPRPYTCDQTAAKLKEVILADHRGDVRQVAVNSDRFAADIAKAEAEHRATKERELIAKASQAAQPLLEKKQAEDARLGDAMIRHYGGRTHMPPEQRSLTIPAPQWTPPQLQGAAPVTFEDLLFDR